MGEVYDTEIRGLNKVYDVRRDHSGPLDLVSTNNLEVKRPKCRLNNKIEEVICLLTRIRSLISDGRKDKTEPLTAFCHHMTAFCHHTDVSFLQHAFVSIGRQHEGPIGKHIALGPACLHRHT